MRPARLACIVWLAIPFFAAGQPGDTHPVKETEKESDSMLGWKWANFAILAIGIGFLIKRSVPPLLRARGEEIQKGLEEARVSKAQAEVRISATRQRMEALPTEVAKMRVELVWETRVEGQRVREDTERQIARIHEQAQQEVQRMVKAARQELMAFSAERALDLAAQRLQDRMTGESQRALVDSFIAAMRSGAAAK